MTRRSTQLTLETLPPLGTGVTINRQLSTPENVTFDSGERAVVAAQKLHSDGHRVMITLRTPDGRTLDTTTSDIYEIA